MSRVLSTATAGTINAQTETKEADIIAIAEHSLLYIYSELLDGSQIASIGWLYSWLALQYPHRSNQQRLLDACVCVRRREVGAYLPVATLIIMF